MANVLSDLFTDIAGTIREKTGSQAKMAPADFPEQIKSIEVGVVENNSDPWYDILSTTTYSGFQPDSESGFYRYDINPSPCVIAAGARYLIIWDDNQEFDCTALQDGAVVVLGNSLGIGGEDSGEPFAIRNLSNGEGMTIYSKESVSEHTIQIRARKKFYYTETFIPAEQGEKASSSHEVYDVKITHKLGVIPDLALVALEELEGASSGSVTVKLNNLMIANMEGCSSAFAAHTGRDNVLTALGILGSTYSVPHDSGNGLDNGYLLGAFGFPGFKNINDQDLKVRVPTLPLKARYRIHLYAHLIV